MCFGEFQDLKQSKISVHNFRCSENFFNVFNLPFDKPGNSQFPDDYKSVKMSRFFSVFAHEFNHGVNSEYITSVPRLSELQDQLIAEAGRLSNNYLRSMFEDSFFTDKPQEFFASIANMYFCSTRDCFYYALKKMKQGNDKQMKQFLFMASIYTENEKCLFYRISEEGDIRIEYVPVVLKDGIIRYLTLDGKKYDFIDLDW